MDEESAFCAIVDTIPCMMHGGYHIGKKNCHDAFIGSFEFMSHKLEQRATGGDINEIYNILQLSPTPDCDICFI
jgi:hypothetical protein